ncbi:hypothetical protein GZ77_26550 [Endozoicomonas montiporae]|uniref:Phage tail protein n=1 Tax=Endozoicomonas montiporae TaxID=1027273 RepID=A0A081MYE9_9GAMM|nr:phage tail protein [Endozoicomonas montiporae]KEQ11222.1 hypothetical protein GZ77_26550 [Endozoicomonas montiporae]
MAEVMMALGDFKFGIDTAQYDSLKESHAWRWAKKNRWGRKPGLQFQGPDSTTKTVPIAVYPQNKKELGYLDSIKAMGDKGEALQLVAGGSQYKNGQLVNSGSYLGLWVIEALEVTKTEFMADGTPLEMKGTLTISEYGDDEP